MDYLLDLILKLLDLIYGERWVAPFVMLPLMFAAAAYIRHGAIKSTKPYLNAAQHRIEVLKQALGDDRDPIAERASFAENYINVSAAMGVDQAGAHGLVLAWREFQESMVDESVSPVRNTNRPSSFFNRAAPKLTKLTFASNVFVGVGLILTFLGLIVALNTAATGMAGGDVGAAKASLQELLVVAGAKFFTSVAGLGASIWLRFSEHGLSREIRLQTDLMCELLERGLLYVSPQRLAVEQLEVMREQRDQLKFFNTDVALQLSERIGAQFTQAIAPVTASLTSLNNKMTSVTEDIGAQFTQAMEPVTTSLTALNDNMTAVTKGIGAGAQEAIEKVSGEQLRGLSETLGELRKKLDAIGTAVGNSSDDAAEQIRKAGEDFANAASDIRLAFESLTVQVDAMGKDMSKRGEDANAAQKKALEAILKSIETAQIESVSMVSGILAALKEGSVDATKEIQSQVGGVIKEGVKATQESFRNAMTESGDALKKTSLSLSKAVGEAAQKIEKAAGGIARTGEGAERTADAIRSVTDNAKNVATSLSNAAQGFSNAAGPVAEAAQSVNQATSQLAKAISSDRAAGAAALGEMKTLAEGVRKTQEAAEKSWHDYRARFEGVDRALANATQNVATTLADSLSEFREFAQNVDREMAAAVGKLGNTMTQIEDYAEALDEYVDLMRREREAAE